MESQRSFLFIALMVVTYLLFDQWQTDNAPIVEAPTQIEAPNSAINNSEGDFIPQSSQTLEPEVETITSQLISVTTDVLTLKINTQGGDIIEAKLNEYDTEQGNGIPFTVMQNGIHKYIAQSGLTGAQGIDRLIPGRPIYQTESLEYSASGDETLTIDLTYITDTNLVVVKRFELTSNEYNINVSYLIKNNSNTPASVQLYGQLKQSTIVESGSALMPTYRGAAYSTSEDPYEKYDFEDIEDAFNDSSANILKNIREGHWVAMLEHYFVTAWVPNDTKSNELYSRFTSNREAVIGFKSPAIIVEPNSEGITSATFYVGPKNQDALEQIDENLDLTIDYGFLFMISQPLFWLLITIQSFVINWGVTIIIITLIVKGGMYPLTKAQYTSMAKMRALQPKINQLKERFGDDRQKMSQGMMELYKKEKVNPAGGCLPLIIQMPIFLALYWVFLESVELRHATFGLWIQDLSAQDPYYILPVLMGISMFIMQKLQPMTIQDPMQQKVMQYMPVMFTIFFFWFPSGLVLYWLVSNVISIVQMKIIFSGLDKAEAKK